MTFLERWAGVLGGLTAVAVLAVLWQLFSAGEDLEARDLRGRTPLVVAAEHGDSARVRELVRLGAEIDMREREKGQTTLMMAVRNRHT